MSTIKTYPGEVLVAATPKTIVTGPTNGTQVVLTITNSTGSSAAVHASVSGTTDVVSAAGSKIAANTVLADKKTLTVGPISVANGFFLVVESSVTNVTSSADGVEN